MMGNNGQDEIRWRSATKALEESLKQGEEAAWKTGTYYNRIVEQKLAEKSGYHRARDFFSSRFSDISQATLTHYGAVAKAFSEADAVSDDELRPDRTIVGRGDAVESAPTIVNGFAHLRVEMIIVARVAVRRLYQRVDFAVP